MESVLEGHGIVDPETTSGAACEAAIVLIKTDKQNLFLVSFHFV
jgi:hypothetical protein